MQCWCLALGCCSSLALSATLMCLPSPLRRYDSPLDFWKRLCVYWDMKKKDIKSYFFSQKEWLFCLDSKLKIDCFSCHIFPVNNTSIYFASHHDVGGNPRGYYFVLWLVGFTSFHDKYVIIRKSYFGYLSDLSSFGRKTSQNDPMIPSSWYSCSVYSHLFTCELSLVTCF